MRTFRPALTVLVVIVALCGLMPVPRVAEAQPPVVAFSGRGSMATGLFNLQAGLVTARFTHNGRSNFIVWLLNASGQSEALLANEIGVASGQSADGIRAAGSFVLDIRADGDWTITIEQPRPTSAPSAPQTYTGRGRSISPFIFLHAGVVTIRSSHNGPSNFIVWLLDANGSTVGLAANEIGTVNNISRAIGVRDSGIHLLDIDARGDWSISIEQTTGAPPAPTATATVPPTLTPIPTPTPRPQPVCTPRPRVTVSVVPNSSNQLTATISATGANNYLRELRFGDARNATISANGQQGTGNFMVTLSSEPQTVSFTVQRTEPGRAVQVPVVVIDGCGQWPTFVGAGTGV